MSGPLKGVKVIDLTAVLMGPFCTQILADLGADVIKIETETGDGTRYIGPTRTEGMGSIFLNTNRNKRSVVLNLKTDEDKDVLYNLIKDADVFVHTLRPQAIKKLGLTYEELKKYNDQLIYCAGYGFGEGGPYSGKPAYDDIIQAASGLAAVQGVANDEPSYMATILADKNTGLMMAISILSALHYREKEGIGQQIEVPMFETMVYYTVIEHLYGYVFDPPIGGSYYPRLTTKYRKPYKTKDGYISVVVYNDKHWENFFTLIGKPELFEDERYNNIAGRTENIEELYKMVNDILLTKTTKEWIKLFEEADIPVMPVNEPHDLLTDPHLQSVNFFEKVEHPTEGKIYDMRFPVIFSKSEIKRRRLAPKLGEHTKEVLNEVKEKTL